MVLKFAVLLITASVRSLLQCLQHCILYKAQYTGQNIVCIFWMRWSNTFSIYRRCFGISDHTDDTKYKFIYICFFFNSLRSIIKYTAKRMSNPLIISAGTNKRWKFRQKGSIGENHSKKLCYIVFDSAVIKRKIHIIHLFFFCIFVVHIFCSAALRPDFGFYA